MNCEILKVHKSAGLVEMTQLPLLEYSGSTLLEGHAESSAMRNILTPPPSLPRSTLPSLPGNQTNDNSQFSYHTTQQS